MVLELLRGGSLRGLLDTGEHLTPAQAVHVGRQVTAALEYAHVRGLVHRDIKPANLLFDEHGILRVADFGLARALAEASWTEPAGFRRRHRSIRGAGASVGRAARRPRRPLRACDRARRVGHGHRPRDVRHRDRHARGAPTHAGARAAGVGSSRSGRRTRGPTGSGRALSGRRDDGRGTRRRGARVPAGAAARASGARRRRRRGCRSHADRWCLDTVVRPGRARRRAGRGRARSRCNTSEGPDRSGSCRWWSRSRSSRRWLRVASRSPSTGGGTVAVPSVVGFSLDQAKIRVATDGLTVTTRRAQRRRPQGRGHRATAGRWVVRGRRHQGAARRFTRTTAGADPRRPEPVARRRAGAARAGRLRRPREHPNDETVAYNHVIDTDPPIGQSAAARLRHHVAREQRSRAGADPRHREHELRRGRASARRQGLRGHPWRRLQRHRPRRQGHRHQSGGGNVSTAWVIGADRR